jgi:hypothetical protein
MSECQLAGDIQQAGKREERSRKLDDINILG